jgi:hypothetical protein
MLSDALPGPCRNWTLCFALLTSLLLPRPASADVYGYSDSWSDDFEQSEWVGISGTPVWGSGITEGTYEDHVGTHTRLLDLWGTELSAQYSSSMSYARADVSIIDDPESQVEGDFETASQHLLFPPRPCNVNCNTQSFFSFAPIGRRVVHTRYYLNRSEMLIDPNFVSCRERHHYVVWNCHGRCQFHSFSTHWIIGAWDPNQQDCVPYDPNWVTPWPYIQGSGSRWRALFFEWCSIAYRGRGNTLFLQCTP